MHDAHTADEHNIIITARERDRAKDREKDRQSETERQRRLCIRL